MSETMYPRVSRGLVEGRRALAPEIEDAFRDFSQKAMAEGAIVGQGQAADRGRRRPRHPMPLLHHRPHQGREPAGATPEEIMEAIWVAAEMRAGAAVAHATLALTELGVGAPSTGGAGS